MLQIVIYKKLNFWEEYTPLPFPKYPIRGERKRPERILA